VLAAISAAAERGTSFGAPTAGEVELASEIARRIDSVEMVRMTSSGTEATMTALRLARAATGRERIVKFEGAYHGHVDGLLAQAGSGLATQAGLRETGRRQAGLREARMGEALPLGQQTLPSSPGVLASATVATTIVPWNDPDALLAATGSGEPVAAILAEPLPANMGVVPPSDGFLELLRARADEIGALLIFDEVISGFRVARGGMQELSGVEPDLTIMGKVVGGGLPAGAVGGRAELMRLLAPAGEVYQAGTLSGNPLAVAAGLTTLALLDEGAYLRLASITEQLAEGLREAAAAAGGAGRGHPVRVASAPGLLTVFFSETPVHDMAAARACDLEAYGRWCRELLSRGVYPPASQFEAWFPSLAHGPEQIELTLVAAAAAFAEIAYPAGHK
jgi:glutamate-1-semialdehyde 2,1-aminomutase